MDFKKIVLLLMILMLVAFGSAMAVSAGDSNQIQNFGFFKMYVPDNVDFQLMNKYRANGTLVNFYENCNESTWLDVQGFDVWLVNDFTIITDVDDEYNLINETNDTKLYHTDNGTYYIIKDVKPIASIGIEGNDLDTITEMANSFEVIDTDNLEDFAQDEINDIFSELNPTSLEA